MENAKIAKTLNETFWAIFKHCAAVQVDTQITDFPVGKKLLEFLH